MTPSPDTMTPSPDATRPIRWGILGCGDIATKRVADAIRLDRHSLLLAACRRQSDLLEAFCHRFAISEQYTDATQLVAANHIDAIYVATPVNCHAVHAISALDQGKDVIVEKPMAMNAKECRDICRAAERNRRQLSVAYYRRFYPIFRRLKALLAEGAIGVPLSIHATTGNGSQFSSTDWRVVASAGGGGPLMDIGSHRIDLFLDLFGLPDRVVASVSTIAANYEVENMASLIVQFKGGVQGILRCYFGTLNVPDAIEVIGTNGRCVIPELNGAELQIYTADGRRTEHHLPPKNIHAPLIADFTKSIRESRFPTVTAEQGMQVNEVIDAAYRSANASS